MQKIQCFQEMSLFTGGIQFILPAGCPARAAQLVSLVGQVCLICNLSLLEFFNLFCCQDTGRIATYVYIPVLRRGGG